MLNVGHCEWFAVFCCTLLYSFPAVGLAPEMPLHPWAHFPHLLFSVAGVRVEPSWSGLAWPHTEAAAPGGPCVRPSACEAGLLHHQECKACPASGNPGARLPFPLVPGHRSAKTPGARSVDPQRPSVHTSSPDSLTPNATVCLPSGASPPASTWKRTPGGKQGVPRAPSTCSFSSRDRRPVLPSPVSEEPGCHTLCLFSSCSREEVKPVSDPRPRQEENQPPGF